MNWFKIVWSVLFGLNLLFGFVLIGGWLAGLGTSPFVAVMNFFTAYVLWRIRDDNT